MHQATDSFYIVRDPNHPENGDEFVARGRVLPSNHSYVTRAPLMFEELNVEDPGAAPEPAKPATKKGT